jgi:hypothetical protein
MQNLILHTAIGGGLLDNGEAQFEWRCCRKPLKEKVVSIF